MGQANMDGTMDHESKRKAILYMVCSKEMERNTRV